MPSPTTTVMQFCSCMTLRQLAMYATIHSAPSTRYASDMMPKNGRLKLIMPGRYPPGFFHVVCPLTVTPARQGRNTRSLLSST